MIVPANLPPPRATKSVNNPPRVVARPKGALPKAPAGFTVQLYADGLSEPRLLRVAPNGDAFVVESEAGVIKVVRGLLATGKAAWSGVFAKDLKQPFGIAFYPAGATRAALYVGNTDSVVRFPYRNGDTKARGAAETIVKDIPRRRAASAAAGTGRATSSSRPTARRCSSRSARARTSTTTRRPPKRPRDRSWRSTPTATNERVFASGIRNPVGLAVHPRPGELWTSVNERDELGDNLVPDYITHVEEGGFYGWPWYYIGGNQDPRHAGKHPELKDKVIVPDVLLQSHMASLD